MNMRNERSVPTMRRLFWIGVACCLGGADAIHAQEVVLPASAVPPPDVAAELVVQEPRTGIVRLGPFDVIPRAETSVYYDSNFANRPQEEDEVVISVTPGLVVVARDMAEEVGKTVSLDYSPSFVFYTQGKYGDEITHNGRLQGRLFFPKLTLGIDQRILFMSDPDVDVSARSKRRTYGTALTSAYSVGEKTSAEVNFSFDMTDYEEEAYTDRWQVANQNWFNYQYGPKLGLGVGLTLGYLELDGPSPNQTFEQGLLRAVYAVAERVSLSVSGGAEVRQFRGGVDDTVNPIWNILGLYRPRDGTSLSVGIYQQYRSSASLDSQDFLRTGGTVTLRQRIFRQLSGSLSAMYYRSEYQASGTGVTASREDDSFLARVGLDTRVGQRWTTGIFGDYHNNMSNVERYDFVRYRVGARVAWSY
jgi:hypothetical protein